MKSTPKNTETNENELAIIGTGARVLCNLGKRGLSSERLKQLSNSPKKTDNLLEFIQMGCPKVKTTGEVVTNQLPEGHELARLILGDDYITAEEVAKVYNLSYSDEQLQHLEESLPDMETILWLRANGYLLIAGLPTDLNILQVRDLDNKLFYSKDGGWYSNDKEKFAKDDKVKAGEWLAIRKEAVPNSFSKTWKEQQKLITDVEHVPSASEMSYVITTYYKVREVRLFENKYVRTSSVDVDGSHVYVGYFDESGLNVDHFRDDYRGDDLGVASSRK
jgi:hypothetical protein